MNEIMLCDFCGAKFDHPAIMSRLTYGTTPINPDEVCPICESDAISWYEEGSDQYVSEV